MFTLIRPISALAFAALAIFAAEGYRALDERFAYLGTQFILWTVAVSAMVGWGFVGGLLGRALWYSIFITLQGVVLAAICTSSLFALFEVFRLGYRRRYAEPVDALAGFFEVATDYLRLVLERDFAMQLTIAGILAGLFLHVTERLLERRRQAR